MRPRHRRAPRGRRPQDQRAARGLAYSRPFRRGSFRERWPRRPPSPVRAATREAVRACSTRTPAQPARLSGDGLPKESRVGNYPNADYTSIGAPSDQRCRTVPDDPALFRKDVEEHPVGQRESRRGPVLELNLETGNIATGMPPEQRDEMPLDRQTKRNHFPQTAWRREAAALSSVDGSPDREPSATPANGPVGRNHIVRRADGCPFPDQLVLVAQLCAAWRLPDPAAANEIRRPADSQRRSWPTLEPLTPGEPAVHLVLLPRQSQTRQYRRKGIAPEPKRPQPERRQTKAPAAAVRAASPLPSAGRARVAHEEDAPS